MALKSTNVANKSSGVGRCLLINHKPLPILDAYQRPTNENTKEGSINKTTFRCGRARSCERYFSAKIIKRAFIIESQYGIIAKMHSIPALARRGPLFFRDVFVLCLEHVPGDDAGFPSAHCAARRRSRYRAPHFVPLLFSSRDDRRNAYWQSGVPRSRTPTLPAPSTRVAALFIFIITAPRHGK